MTVVMMEEKDVEEPAMTRLAPHSLTPKPNISPARGA